MSHLAPLIRGASRHPISVLLDDRHLQMLDDMVKQLNTGRPRWQRTSRADLIRYCIRFTCDAILDGIHDPHGGN